MSDNVYHLKGISSNFRSVIDKAEQMAKVRAPVLIVGETGSGKDEIANYIHFLDKGKGKLEKFDATVLGLDECQDLLFGNLDTPGLLEDESITIYINNIELLDQTNQYRFLRILEYNELNRTGRTTTNKAEARIIASAKPSFKSLLETGEFREDFFFRLSLLMISLPSLKERREDIYVLAEYFLSLANQLYNKKCRLKSDVFSFFLQYPFPGNVRELRNIIESLVITGEPKQEFGMDDLPDWVWDVARKNTNIGFTLMKLEEIEKNAILRTLKAVNGNRQKAAKILGISERNLYRKIKEYETLLET